MALEHCFSIIKNKEKIEKVNIPDDFINYIKDSLFWIVSSWNGKTLKSGLPYYGEALISDEELVKFKTILEKWRGLFSLGTEEINLTCIFRKNRALAPHERSAVPLGTDHCPVG